MATLETTRRGHRQSSLPTPEAIRRAATTLLSRNGFSGTSVREIARVAGVDPALVIRHFGSKEALFIETVPSHGPFDEVLCAPLDDFGERIVEFILNRLDRHSFNVFLELLRASGSDAIRRRMGEMMIASFGKLNDQLSGADASLRTRLVAAQVDRVADDASWFTSGFAPERPSFHHRNLRRCNTIHYCDKVA